MSITPVDINTSKSDRKVSNSEVITFQTCKHRYHLCFDLNLEPVNPGTALYRGTVGHVMLQAYYEHFIGLYSGQKTDEVYRRAEDAAWAKYRTYYAHADMSQEDILLDLKRIMERYFHYVRYYPDDLKSATNSNQKDWIILQVERYYDLDLTEDFRYVARLDLVARIDGLITIVDHKFTYNFWSQDKLDLNPQLPKYVGIMRNNGVRVDQVMVNQVRYRWRKSSPYIDTEMFKYAFYTPTPTEVRTHLKEQILVSKDVVEWRVKPLEERARIATRILNDMVCGSCPVKGLCIMGLKGIDIANEIKAAYQPNTYDYNLRALEETEITY
jgi:hypothetical protein